MSCGQAGFQEDFSQCCIVAPPTGKHSYVSIHPAVISLSICIYAFAWCAFLVFSSDKVYSKWAITLVNIMDTH